VTSSQTIDARLSIKTIDARSPQCRETRRQVKNHPKSSGKNPTAGQTPIPKFFLEWWRENSDEIRAWDHWYVLGGFLSIRTRDFTRLLRPNARQERHSDTSRTKNHTQFSSQKDTARFKKKAGRETIGGQNTEKRNLETKTERPNAKPASSQLKSGFSPKRRTTPCPKPGTFTCPHT
jgi:hypothetical protein